MWTKENYPDKMKNLPDETDKTIEIANVLKEDETNQEEGTLTNTAINRSENWTTNNIKNSLLNAATERFVIPYGEKEWAVKEDGKKDIEYVFRNKKEAVKLATAEAKRTNSAVTIQKRNGKTERRISYSTKSKAKKNR